MDFITAITYLYSVPLIFTLGYVQFVRPGYIGCNHSSPDLLQSYSAAGWVVKTVNTVKQCCVNQPLVWLGAQP